MPSIPVILSQGAASDVADLPYGAGPAKAMPLPLFPST